MKCPICHLDMTKGYLHNGRQPLEWVPDGKKAGTFTGRFSRDGVPLQNGKFSVWTGYKAEAFYCANCKIVLAREGQR